MNQLVFNGSDDLLSKVIFAISMTFRSTFGELKPFDFSRSVVHHIRRPGRAKLDLEEYCPAVFDDVRRIFGYTNEELQEEWDILDEISSEESAGKSGSYFIMSKSKKFLVKSIEKSEKEMFLQMIPDYYKHMVKYQKSTTLMKIIGIYRLKDTTNKSFIMFDNILLSPLEFSEKYDLKGSTKDRHASNTEKEKRLPVLLDNDLTESQRIFSLGEFKPLLLEQIHLDTELLMKYNAMDYSLLVGIHKLDENEEPEALYVSERGRNVWHVTSSNRDEIYFVGIIDCLTVYNTSKKIAHTFKKIKHTKESLSTVPSEMYCERFREFANSIFDGEE